MAQNNLKTKQNSSNTEVTHKTHIGQTLWLWRNPWEVNTKS